MIPRLISPWLGPLACLLLSLGAGCESEPETLQPPVLVKEVAPAYPSLEWDVSAPPAKITLSVLVDKGGRVAEIHWITGDELLRTQVEVALLKWRFEPARLGDEIVESTFAVSFDMTPPEEVPRKPAPVPRVLHRIQPTFPVLTKTDAINRQEAILEISIDAEGRVKKASWVSGPEALREPSMGAVKQWRYEPVALPEGLTLYTFQQSIVYRFE